MAPLEFSGHNDGFKKGSMWCIAPVHRFLYESEKDWFRYCEKFKEFGDDREPPPYPYDLEYMYELLKSEEEDGFQMGVRQGACRAQDLELVLAAADERNKEAVITQSAEIEAWKAADIQKRKGKFVPAEEWDHPAEQPELPEGWDMKLKDMIKMATPSGWAEEELEGEKAEKPQAVAVRPETGGIEPRTEMSFYPAKHLLKLRSSSPDFGRSPSPTTRKLQEEWLSAANMVKDAILQQSKMEALGQ